MVACPDEGPAIARCPSPDRSSAGRFEREAKAAARLESPYVVQVHDFGVDDGAPYIAMELLALHHLERVSGAQSRSVSPIRASRTSTR